MVELTANGQQFELLENSAKIKITKQIADIFNIAKVSSSYTNGFKVPKTPHNTRIMQNLGIVGDQSGIPYQKVPSTLSKDGFSIFYNGWLSVSDTTEYYNVKIADGIIDFFKAIENKTMGADLDLADFNHSKDLNSVIASFTNDFYTYIIADYNGKKEAKVNGITGINIDYLVPSFNMGKLFELVMGTFGFTYDTTNIAEINDMYITYPNEIVSTNDDVIIAEFTKDFFEAIPTPINPGSDTYHIPQEYHWTTQDVTEGTVIQNWRFVVPESAGYKFTISTEMYAAYQRPPQTITVNGITYNSGWGTPYFRPVQVTINKNSSPFISINTNHEQAVTAEASLYFDEGDIIEIQWTAPFTYGYRQLRYIRHNTTFFNIYKTNAGSVSLSDAFKDFQIKDFIKEVFWRTAVTPIIDTVTNHITFATLDDRLDYAIAEDWSDKYVRRTKEDYLDGFYAQKNAFKHKHNDENDISSDGYLYVDNKNIEAEKTIVSSKIYAPENINAGFFNGSQTVTTKRYSIWLPEPKEDDEGFISVEYKGLTNRFYILKKKQSPVGDWDLVSEKIIGTDTVMQIPYADIAGTTFSQIVPDKYAKYNWLLNQFRAHDIELVLTTLDIMNLDLTRPKYFEQEAAYYVLNRVTFDEGKNAVGEFIRINKI